MNFVCLWIQFVLKKSKKRSPSRNSKAHSPVRFDFVWTLESERKKGREGKKDGEEKEETDKKSLS